MSDAWRTVGIDGDIDPARSRHTGRRSAVALTEGCVVVGTAGGAVIAYDRRTLDERWRAGADAEAAVVSVAPVGDSVVAGERGPDGGIDEIRNLCRKHKRYDGAVARSCSVPQV